MGWLTIGSPGTGYYATPEEACQVQFDAYATPKELVVNFGASPTSNPRIYDCRWTHYPADTFPSNTTFYCTGGYHYVGSNRCESDFADTPRLSGCPNAPKPVPHVGNPISVFEAAKLENVTDFTTQDGKLALGRSYSSLVSTVGINANNDTLKGSVGGWRYNFELEVHLGGSDASTATLHLPDGTAFDFTRSGNVYAPTSGANLQTRYQLAIVGSPPSSWSNITAASTQWKVTDLVDRSTYVFQTFSKGPATNDTTFDIAQPITMTTPGGYAWTYAYDVHNTLTSITDSYGRAFQFTWNYLSYNFSGGTDSSLYAPVTIKQVTLPGGSKMLYTYDPPLDANGYSPSRNIYHLVRAEMDDASGNVIGFTTYQYENATYSDLLTGVTDARGVRYATFTYDAAGRAISTEHAGGQDKYTIAFNTPSTSLPNELVRTVTNPLGKVTEYHFAHPANAYLSTLTSVIGQPSTNCVGSTGSYTYDANGFIASFTDEEGRVTAYVNDAQGRPTSITRGSGTPQAVTTTMTWDATYHVATQVVEPGVTTTQTLNATSGLVTQQQKQDTTTQTVPYSTNGQVRTLTYGYDSTGRLTSVTGPLSGVSTGYTYDPAGFLKTVTNELGQVTTVTSANPRGQPTALTDPNGVVTTLAYDGHGWLTGVSVDTANTPATTTIAYDAVGDVASITDPIGGSQTFAYDNARRLTSVTTSAGEVTTYTRDAMGNATSVTITGTTSATAYSKTRTFDELGRIIKEVGAVSSNSTYQFGYDRTDNLTSVTDPRSNVFSNGFDALNRLITETDEGSATVTLSRNGIDAITSYKDPRNITTSYVRNGFGEIIQEVSPDKGTTSYVRDARGLVTARTDPRGIVTNFTYDNAGRLTGKSYPSQTSHNATLTWDATGPGNAAIGRLVGISNGAAADWRDFDTKGNITVNFRGVAPMTATVTTSYTYDAAGNIAAMTYPSGHVVKFQRDTLGRITNVAGYPSPTSTAATTLASAITWNPFGPIHSLTFGNGLVETFSTDTDYRITEVKIASPGASAPAGDRVLTWMGETLTGINDTQIPSLSESFTYTPARRLAGATGSYGTFAWTYDGVGNRTFEQLGSVLSTYAYPTTSNRLASITPGTSTPRSFTYDAAGDIATDTRSGGLGLTFQYDEEGHLSQTYQTNATANGATYTYDARDRLSSRTATQTTAPTSTTTLYLYDLADHIIAELDASGQTLKEYVWLNDMPIAVIDGVNTATTSIYFVHVDHLMRPILMTDQNQTWVWYAIYKPFGETATLYANPEVMDGRFPGQWFQLETGLAYNWHRHYDPTTGRYLQPDPLKIDDGDATVGGISTGTIPGGSDGRAVAKSMGWQEAHDIIMGTILSRHLLQDGPSLYGYVGQNPTGKVDPSGLQPNDKRFGLPDLFWRWYHRCVKQPGDPDLDYQGACDWHNEWCRLGKPKA